MYRTDREGTLKHSVCRDNSPPICTAHKRGYTGAVSSGPRSFTEVRERFASVLDPQVIGQPGKGLDAGTRLQDLGAAVLALLLAVQRLRGIVADEAFLQLLVDILRSQREVRLGSNLSAKIAQAFEHVLKDHQAPAQQLLVLLSPAREDGLFVRGGRNVLLLCAYLTHVNVRLFMRDKQEREGGIHLRKTTYSQKLTDVVDNAGDSPGHGQAVRCMRHAAEGRRARRGTRRSALRLLLRAGACCLMGVRRLCT